jgi:acetyl-CoA acetyltransferase
MDTLKDKAAIIGIGETDFSRDSGRTETKMAIQAALAACEDAGADPHEIDGLVMFEMDATDNWGLIASLGMKDVKFLARTFSGGGAACATVMLGALAVATGQANMVLCWRSLNEYSGRRFGQPSRDVMRVPGENQFHIPYGIMTPGQWVAMLARRHMYKYGTTRRQLGSVAMNSRTWAATNPRARFYERPLTWDEYERSRMVADPLRTHDCCLESDGAVAVLVTRAERARDFKQPPVYIMAAAYATGPKPETMTNFYRDDMTISYETRSLADQLFGMAGVERKDIDVVQVYDHFSPLVIMVLEDLGFAKKGEGGPFVESGALGPGGSLPTNTAGGLMGEAYIHGLNLISEGARQVRGDSPNQVRDVELSLVSAGNGVPTSGLILRK